MTLHVFNKEKILVYIYSSILVTAVISVMYGKGSTDPGIIFLADRMVSYGQMGVESSNSKLYEIKNDPDLKVVMGAAGTLSPINEFYDKLMESSAVFKAKRVKDIAREAAKIQADMAKERIETVYLSPLDLNFEDFHADRIGDQAKRIVVDKMLDTLDNMSGAVQSIIAGVDKTGAHIYSVQGFDYNTRDILGYDTTGSGFEPANWILMHRAYDAKLDEKYALFMSAFAKIQAEQSWGVGENTDGYIIRKSGIDPIKPEIIKDLRTIVRNLMKKDNDNIDKSLSNYGNGVVKKNGRTGQ